MVHIFNGRRLAHERHALTENLTSAVCCISNSCTVMVSRKSSTLNCVTVMHVWIIYCARLVGLKHELTFCGMHADPICHRAYPLSPASSCWAWGCLTRSATDLQAGYLSNSCDTSLLTSGGEDSVKELCQHRGIGSNAQLKHGKEGGQRARSAVKMGVEALFFYTPKCQVPYRLYIITQKIYIFWAAAQIFENIYLARCVNLPTKFKTICKIDNEW